MGDVFCNDLMLNFIKHIHELIETAAAAAAAAAAEWFVVSFH